MHTLLHIPTAFIDLSNGDILYPFFYQLAMFSGILWLVYEGYRRKFPMVPWLLSLAMLMLFSVAGTKFSAWNSDDYRLLFQDGIWPDLNKKSSLGGFAGGFIAILLSRKIFRFDNRFFDAFALFPMIVMFIQRMGCLAAGCCYGTTCEGSGLGVQYFGDGKLRNLQLESGLIDSWQWTSVVVHAVPVYLMIAAMLSAMAVIFIGPKLKNAGSKALLGLIFMAGGRFIIEFVRDPSTNHALGQIFFGLKAVQWIGILAIISLTLWLWWHENRILNNVHQPSKIEERPAYFILAMLAIFAYELNYYFSFFEKAVVFAMLLTVMLVMVRKQFLDKSYLQRPIFPAGLGMMALLMMSQTFRYNGSDSSRNSTVFKLNQSYQDMIIPEYPYCIESQTAQGCDGSPGSTLCTLADSLRPLGKDYYQTQLSFEHYFHNDPEQRVEFMVGGGVNHDIFKNKSTLYSENFTQAFAEIGIEGKKYFGVKLGAHMGSFASAEKIPDQRNSAGVNGFTPHMQLWFGNKDFLTVEGFSYFGGNNSGMMSRSKVSLNLNMHEITEGRIGQIGAGVESIQLGSPRVRYFLKSEILLPNHFSLVPQMGYTAINSGSFALERGYTGGLGLRYDLSRIK